MEENEAFWSTVAQLSPVLALALVLETRLAASKYTKKKRFRKERVQRIYFGVSFGLAFFLVFWSFAFALLSLMDRAPEWVAPQHALYSLTVVFVIVAQMPLQMVLFHMLGDVIAQTMRQFPWSIMRRIQRRKRQVRDVLNQAERRMRAKRIETWIDVADLLIRMTRTVSDRPSDQSLSRKFEKDLNTVREQMIILRAQRVAAEQAISDARQEVSDIGSRTSERDYAALMSKRLREFI